MENKICTAKRQNHPTGYLLLPNYFKKIGLIVILGSIILPFIILLFNKDFSTINKDVIKTLGAILRLIGLYFIAGSKDKVEDEMTAKIRMQSLGLIFFMNVVQISVIELGRIIANDSTISVSGPQLVCNMLLLYIIMYYFRKKAA